MICDLSLDQMNNFQQYKISFYLNLLETEYEKYENR